MLLYAAENEGSLSTLCVCVHGFKERVAWASPKVYSRFQRRHTVSVVRIFHWQFCHLRASW